MSGVHPTETNLRASIEKFASLGLKIQTSLYIYIGVISIMDNDEAEGVYPDGKSVMFELTGTLMKDNGK